MTKIDINSNNGLKIIFLQNRQKYTIRYWYFNLNSNNGLLSSLFTILSNFSLKSI